VFGLECGIHGSVFDVVFGVEGGFLILFLASRTESSLAVLHAGRVAVKLGVSRSWSSVWMRV